MKRAAKAPVLQTEAKPRRVGDGTPGPGRPKGLPNKTTTDVKAMILGALSDGGGRRWLRGQMDKNPTAFMALIGRVLPKEVLADVEATLRIIRDDR